MSYSQYLIRDCLLDCQTMVLSFNSKEVKLSVKVFDFLMLFLASEEQIVNKDDAIDRIWLGNEGVGKRGVTNAIWSLRKAFTELGIEDEVFQTLPKVGYKLLLPASPIPFKTTRIGRNVQAVNRFSVLAGTLIVVVIALAFIFLKPNIPDRQVSQIPADKSITTFEGIEEHPAISHDGKYLAFQWIRDSRKGQIYVKELQEHNAPLKLISMSDQEETSPAWSIDDDKLAYIRVSSDGNCEVRVRDILSNKDSLIDTGCFYAPYRNVLTWSNVKGDDYIVYSKRVGGAVALFKYDFINQKSSQLTFPQVYETDYAPELTEGNKKLVFIREKGQQHYDLVALSDGEVEPILAGLISIVGIAVNQDDDTVFVNYSKSGQFNIDRINLNTFEASRIANRRLPSNISFDKTTNSLMVADHISKEYIGLANFETGKVTRRVSSSSRDMYGRYLKSTDQILFLSNRSGIWSVWLKSKLNSTNLTGEVGNATVPAISPDEKQYVVKISSVEGNSSDLYLGTLISNQLQKLDTNGLQVENLSWSQNGQFIYFFSSKGDDAGIYRLELKTSKIVQMTNSNEQYAVEMNDGSLLVSRLNQSGLWRYFPQTKDYQLVTDELSSGDYGSFFTDNDTIYYINRAKFTDELKSIEKDGRITIKASFPRNTVRKYFGISKGSHSNFLATLKITNEADINLVALAEN